MPERLRGDVTLAVAISAGVLIATGYVLTFALLTRLDVPPVPVLSALPRGYYIGKSLQAMILPFLIVLTLGAAWLFFAVSRGAEGDFPRSREWSSLSLSIAIYAWFGASISYGSLQGDVTFGYVTACLGAALGLIVTSLALARYGAWRLAEVERPSRTDKAKIVGAIALLLCVLGASSYRVIDAFFLPEFAPFAAVYTEKDACQKKNPRRGRFCLLRGVYIGESGDWLYLIKEPSPRLPDVYSGRLILVPKEAVRHVDLADNEQSLPLPQASSSTPPTCAGSHTTDPQAKHPCPSGWGSSRHARRAANRAPAEQ
jgi:hypothetical protein